MSTANASDLYFVPVPQIESGGLNIGVLLDCLLLLWRRPNLGKYNGDEGGWAAIDKQGNQTL